MRRAQGHRRDPYIWHNRVGVAPAKLDRLKRDVSINSKIVVCPQCKAQVNQPCINAEGEVTRNIHRSRRRMAVRKLNAERNQVELP